MSYKFGKRSKQNLGSCHPDLQKITNEAIKEIDFSVICGHRNKKDQNEAYRKGNSEVKYPHGKHNKIPSRAFDFIPWPFKSPEDWDNTEKFRRVADVFKEKAKELGIEVTWGGDWGWDWGHFELKD